MGTSTKELLNQYADYKEHFKSEQSISSDDEEELEYIPEKTVTRTGRI